MTKVPIVGPPALSTVEVSGQAFVPVRGSFENPPLQAGFLIIPPLLTLTEMSGIDQRSGVARGQNLLGVVVIGAQSMVQFGTDYPAGVGLEHVCPPKVLIAPLLARIDPGNPAVDFLDRIPRSVLNHIQGRSQNLRVLSRLIQFLVALEITQSVMSDSASRINESHGLISGNGLAKEGGSGIGRNRVVQMMLELQVVREIEHVIVLRSELF